ncbi:MAG: glycosyltransferase [Chlamydiota bacterium]
MSVICPTYHREHYHANLYQAFAWQTHDNKELLILDDSPQPSSFFLGLKDPQVKYFYSSTRLSIGAKRNYLNEKASGEIIAHFDDDDYYAPDYLSEMITQLRDFDLIKYSRWLAWRELDGTLWEWDTNYVTDFHYLVSGNGPSNILVKMCSPDDSLQKISQWNQDNKWGYGFSYVYKKSMWESCQFENINGKEDIQFVKKALALGKKISCVPDFKHLTLHRIHAKNTSHIFPQHQCSVQILAKSAAPWLTNILQEKIATKEHINQLFKPFLESDPDVTTFIDNHHFDDYEICTLGNG